MLRNLINGKNITTIYKVTADTKRGSLVVKNLTTSSADKADSVGTETYLLDFDYQPTGVLSDVEVSAYDATADLVPAGTYAILVKPAIGTEWATDQIDGVLAAGDYLVAGASTKTGLFIKATTGKISPYKCLGTYDDAGHTLTRFEVVEPKTI